VNYNFLGFKIFIFFFCCAAASGCANLYRQSACTDSPQLCIEKAINQARSYGDDHQWAEAVIAIEKALEQFPEQPDLIKLKKQYEDCRSRSVSENQYQIMLKKSRYLLDVRENKEKLFYSVKDRQAAIHEHKIFQDEVEQLAGKLFNKGQQFMEEKNFSGAREVLTLSDRLVASTAARQMIEEIHRVMEEKQSAAIRDIQITKNQKWCVLESDFEKNIKAGNLLKAKKMLSEMQAINPEKSNPMDLRLQELIDRQVETMLEKGRYFYLKGDLNQAQNIWKEALELKPDDPRLLEHIERAGKFIENLDRWDK
jgi:tetratricopeptide (TPR) repeat protein